jgi:hypothetical protein
MEHREPPRIGPVDTRFDSSTEVPGGRFRLRRFESDVNGRSIDYRRIAVFGTAGLVLLAGVVYLSAWTARHSAGWLAQQPEFQLPFDRIELVPAPPRWYLHGSEAFLDDVRKTSHEPDHISLLEVAPEDLTTAFRKYPWVNEVTRVAYAPGHIRVELRYRQPVAWVQLRNGRQFMVDDEGCMLPTENIDVEALGRVPKIIGEIEPPVATQYGEKWKSRSEPGGRDEVDERIQAAARLAGFLMQVPQRADADRSSALRITQIIVTAFEKRGLFVFNAEGAIILWGDAPSGTRSGVPTADEKWAILRHWERSTAARFLDQGDYWAFEKNQLVHRCPDQHKVRHHPKTASERATGS